MHRYVIAIEGFSSEEEREFADFLRASGEWWHWISNVWLLIAEKRLSVADIRMKVGEINDAADLLVIEVSDTNAWSVVLPQDLKTKESPGLAWMRDKWAPKIVAGQIAFRDVVSKKKQ